MVHWVELPGDKRRPARIVSPALRNEAARSVLVAPISSQLRVGPWHVELRAGEAGLPLSSVVKCEDIQPIRRELLSARPLGGPLSQERMRQVEDALMSAQGILR